MDIAAMSVVLNQAKVQQQAGLAVMKMAMNTSKDSVDMLTELAQASSQSLETAVRPHLGGNIDIRL